MYDYVLYLCDLPYSFETIFCGSDFKIFIKHIMMGAVGTTDQFMGDAKI